MNQPKNSVTLVLIFSSIIFLLALQVIWLQKVFKDESEDFRKETHALFRNVIFDMSDSLLMKSIEPFPGDSMIHYFTTKKVDTMRLRNGKRLHIKDSVANVQVFISSSDGKDSVERFLRPLITRIRGDRSQKKFSIRLDADSLHLSDIEKKFKKVLAAAAIDAPFTIKRVKSDIPPPRKRITLSDEIIFTPNGGYQLVFPDLTVLVLKKISLQILFSIFLTLLTVGSFFLLYRSLKMQQRLMALKNDFISNITHELKTPVTTVGVALEALKNFNGLDNPKLTQEYLDIAQNELSRLNILTDKILKTAIFEDKGVDYKSEAIELDKLVDQVLASMKLVFEKQKANVSFTREGNDFRINGGSAHLTSVIYNLLDNALKYSPTDPEIVVVLKEDVNNIILAVKDHGVGIAPEYKKKIFEKFFRVPTGDIHNIKGYGLGLSYVESVVKSHGGTITVESEIGKGSCFTITLPRNE